MKDLGLPEDILDVRQLPDPLRLPRSAGGAEGHPASRCRRWRPTRWRLWDYWERHLDPDLSSTARSRAQVKGKVVLITGGSSGIGLATAHKVAAAGATTIIIARDPEKLAEAKKEIEADGHDVVTYSADVSDARAVRRAGDEARGRTTAASTSSSTTPAAPSGGRSRTRSTATTTSSARCRSTTTARCGSRSACCRSMIKKRRGHVINISSIGVLTNAPRFSAYVASKAALDAWTRCAASEFADMGIQFTTINMPLVRTPMIAPTKIYNQVPTLSPGRGGRHGRRGDRVQAGADRDAARRSSARCCTRCCRASRRSS